MFGLKDQYCMSGALCLFSNTDGKNFLSQAIVWQNLDLKDPGANDLTSPLH